MAVSKRIRTDLALETTERFKEEKTEIRGVEIQEDYDEEKDVRTTVVRIVTENGAKAMGRPCVKISLAGVSDALFLRGTQTVFNNAKPGRIVDALVHEKSFCPLILLDEIDKMGSVVADITGSSGHCRITSIYDKRQKANCERIHLAKTDQGVSNRAGRY